MRQLLCWLVAGAICVGFAGRVSADLVVNGGFETGNFSGWTQSGDTSFTGVSSGAPIHSGSFAAFFGSVSNLGFITQNLATVPGTSYTLEFWLTHPFTDTNTEWLVKVGSNTLIDVVNAANFPYTKFTFNFTATSATTALQFGFKEVPAFFFLDDISVNAAVPEPTSFLAWGVIGAAGVIVSRLRLRRRSAAAV